MKRILVILVFDTPVTSTPVTSTSKVTGVYGVSNI